MKILKLLSVIAVALVTVSILTYTPVVGNSKPGSSVMMYIGSSLAYVHSSETFIDPDNPGAVPVVENDRTLVPMRFVSESFNAEVTWEQTTKTATIKYGNKTVKFSENSSEMISEGKSVQMDVPARNIGGKFYVPLRYMAEAIDKETFYDRGLIIISDDKNAYDPVRDREALDGLIAKLNNLPVVGTEAELIRLCGEPAQTRLDMVEYDMEAGVSDSVTNQSQPMPAPTAAAAGAKESSGRIVAEAAYDSAEAAGSNYSTTNIQVAGVDEGDIIKTDGENIYFSRNNSVSVVKASPAQSMEVLYTVTFDDTNFAPQELYVDGNYMAVVGATSKTGGTIGGRSYHLYKPLTRTYVFDLTDKKNIKKVREVDSEGDYISSRKIGKTLYVLSEAYVYNMAEDGKYTLPVFRDSAVDTAYVDIPYDRIRYFPGINMIDRNYLSITGFEINNTDKKAIVNTYLGSGRNVYVSGENLYVARENYNYRYVNVTPRIMPFDRAVPEAADVAVSSGITGETSTIIYKFSLNQGNATYLCRGEVEGTVLNQFSMDESKGFFRIATTGYDYQGEHTNNMFVLDENLKLTGKIKEIAPGERIYSARFMGDRAYMVTFKNVDPLFVIDLKDPRNPKILGALKIPGYSDYLHPYDENHLIGFGKETVEQYGSAYYQGMKLSMFDVTDVANPKELFKETIGDRGTESELLNNHRALLFSKERNILAFPVMVYEVKEGEQDSLKYGDFSFQGAYVYGIDMNKGFQLKGKISHLTDQDYLKAGMYGGNYNKYIQRIIYIGEYFYTASNSILKATSVEGMKDVSTLELSAEEYDRVYKE